MNSVNAALAGIIPAAATGRAADPASAQPGLGRPATGTASSTRDRPGAGTSPVDARRNSWAPETNAPGARSTELGVPLLVEAALDRRGGVALAA